MNNRHCRSVAIMLSIATLYTMASCNSKRTDDKNIIAHKEDIEQKVEDSQPQKVGDYAQTDPVSWLGKDYNVDVARKADTTMPLIADDNTGKKYYDNKITVRISRADGSELFKKEFVKSDFSQYIDDSFLKKSALLGIVYDHVDGENLVFGASVGLPDRLSDEFIPLTLKISNSGKLSVSKDANLEMQSEN